MHSHHMMPGEVYKACLILWLYLTVKSSKDYKGSLCMLVTKHTPLPLAKQSIATPWRITFHVLYIWKIELSMKSSVVHVRGTRRILQLSVNIFISSLSMDKHLQSSSIILKEGASLDKDSGFGSSPKYVWLEDCRKLHFHDLWMLLGDHPIFKWNY